MKLNLLRVCSSLLEGFPSCFSRSISDNGLLCLRIDFSRVESLSTNKKRVTDDD